MSDFYQAGDRGLRNRLGITDAGVLLDVECTLSALNLRRLFLGEATLDAPEFSFAWLQSIHWFLFKDVYDWAGEVRTVPLAKDIDEQLTSLFAPPQEIIPRWQALEEEIAVFMSGNDLGYQEKLQSIVDFFAAANHIHAFYRGNGRALQFFIAKLSEAQGIDLDFALLARSTGGKQ